MKKLQVKFSVSGWVTTEVEVHDALTPQEFQDGLNSGKYLTSMIPRAPIMLLKLDMNNNFEDIGKVVELTEPNCEYSDFEVKESLDNQS